MPNLLPNGVGATPASKGEISSFEEVSAKPGPNNTNKSYPEAEPCTPAGKGSPLSYSGKTGALDEPRTYNP